MLAAGLKQHISGATQKKGHTLDLIISRICDDLVVNPLIIHNLFRSDQFAVRCVVNVSRPTIRKQTVKFRKNGVWLSMAIDLTRCRFFGVPLRDLSSDP